jgi:hypothetical protein
MSDWTLVYAADASGNATSGSLSALRHAVRHAADVKVMYNANDNWWARECISACSRGTGSSAIVAATCLEAVDTHVTAKGLELTDPVALEYHVYNSNGWRSRSTAGVIDSHRFALRWYVRSYQFDWRPFEGLLSEYLDRNP